MNKRFQLNIYFKRNNRACLVFKRSGTLYRINNLTMAKEFVEEMKGLSMDLAKSAMEDSYLELYDHRAKTWVLECTRSSDNMVVIQLWFQSISSGEHLDVRFSWRGTGEEFMTAVNGLAVAANEQRIYRLYKKN